MKKTIKLHIGDICSENTPTVFQTILGSCVAACIYDPIAKVGGMNHILLPCSPGINKNDPATQYGINSMELLVRKVIMMGGIRQRLVAKIFGGANVLSKLYNDGMNVGRMNAEFVTMFLRDNGIKIISQDLGGNDTRTIHFHTDTGEVLLKRSKSVQRQDVAKAETKSFKLISTALSFSQEKEKLDVLQELINIGAGKAAQSLNFMLHSHIELRVPLVKCFLRGDEQNIHDVISQWGIRHMTFVQVPIIGELSGNAQLIFSNESAEKLASVMLADSGEREINDTIVAEVMKEIGNVVINGVVGTLGNLLKVNIAYRTPVFKREDMSVLSEVERDVAVILTVIGFHSKELNIPGNLFMTFKVDSFKFLDKALTKFLREKIGYRA